MLTLLDASAIRRWCRAAAEDLAEHRQEIDDLNVFPIPDGDTGTNLELTLASAAEAVAADRSATCGAVLAAMARGAVMGARGNSGVIVSHVLRGFADAVGDTDEADGRLLAEALQAASDTAYAGVSDPVEGTILSVIRAAAAAAAAAPSAAAAGPHDDLATVVRAACAAAGRALAKTPQQLEVLAKAGVVDAGGRGLVVLLDALAAVITGQPAPSERPPGVGSRAGLDSVRRSEPEQFGYEVQYLLHAEEAAVAELRTVLDALGDSLVIAGTGQGLFNVHVHVNDVGAAIEAGVEAGRPHRITVIRFADQVAREPAGSGRSGVALVAVAPGIGLADLFSSEGVAVVDGNPSVAEVYEQIMATGAAQVILLPNASAVGGVAELAAEQAREHGVSVAVVPTKSPVQGLAAVAVHDSSRRFEDNVIALAEAAAATRFAEVTIAVRESITYAGRCAAGDVLGLIDGEVVEIGSDVSRVGISLVSRLVAAGGELVTVLTGSDPDSAAAAEAVATFLRRGHPLVEVNAFVGGQPHYPLLIGVE